MYLSHLSFAYFTKRKRFDMDVYSELKKVVREERREKNKVLNMFRWVKDFLKEVKKFFQKLWFEIAPAFYTAMLICGILSSFIFVIAYIWFVSERLDELSVGFILKIGIVISSIFTTGSVVRIIKADEKKRDKLFKDMER